MLVQVGQMVEYGRQPKQPPIRNQKHNNNIITD